MKRMIAFFSALACLVAVLCPAALADSSPALTAAVSTAVVEPGESFTVQVNLSGNPGLFGLAIELAFDDNVMRLSGAESGSVFAGEMAGPYTDKSGAKMAWFDMSGNNTNNGCLVTLTFTALDEFSPGTASITVKVNEGDAANLYEEIAVKPCTVSVNLHGEVEWVTTKEATCTEDGSREQICSGCQLVLATETIPALGHSWDAGKVTKEPTCTEAGETAYTCTVCGETRTEAIPALGHSWDAGKVTKEPTCTEAGETAYTCTVCGETKTEAIPALGHSWDAGKVTREPTCTEAGETAYTCTVCGETKTEAILALGHTWGEWETVTEPTVGGEGLRKHTCTVCGEAETETIPALDPEATPTPVPDNDDAGSDANADTPVSGDTSPKTGDNAPIAVYMGLTLSGLLGMVVLRRRRLF